MMIENLKKQLELILEKFEKNTSDLLEKEEKSSNEIFNIEEEEKVDNKNEIDIMKDDIQFLKEEVSILSAEILHIAKVLEMQQNMVSKLYQVNLKLMSAISPNSSSDENDIFKKQSNKKDFKPN